jgi:hypothetical protein
VSYVAGIDYDSNGVYVVLIDEDSGTPLFEHGYDLACGPGDAFDRARRVRHLLPAGKAWDDAGVIAAGIEDPYTRQLNSLVAQVRVQGAILSCLPRGLLVEPMRAQRWKLLALGAGNGNAGKPAVANWARANGMADGLRQDFYDAFAIARATRAELERSDAAA